MGFVWDCFYFTEKKVPQFLPIQNAIDHVTVLYNALWYACELVHTLHVGKDIYVSMSHYNRLFRFLPHQKILYSNNLINPVNTLDTRDDLIFKYSSTRINTVCTQVESEI